jgi:hypothetical protein
MLFWTPDHTRSTSEVAPQIFSRKIPNVNKSEESAGKVLTKLRTPVEKLSYTEGRKSVYD